MAEQEYGWTVQVVYPEDRQLKRYAPDVLDESGFKVISKRWIVERTQPQYLQSALDAQRCSPHDRTHWAAEVA